MQTLSTRKPIFNLPPHAVPSNFLSSPIQKTQSLLRIYPRRCLNSFKTLCLCSATSPHSLSYGGWDDLQLQDDSARSGESNQRRNFMNSLGIGDKKYAFVYLFGFVCALAISRVRVSSIVVFPACAIIFALGFSAGLVKMGNVKDLKLNGNRRMLMDETVSGFIENLRNLRGKLNGYNTKVLSLKNDIRRSIECNQVTVNDLEGYIDAIDSMDITFVSAIDIIESCIQRILSSNQEKEGNSDHQPIRRRKKLGENGFNFFQIFSGLFGEQFGGSKTDNMKDSGERELMDVEVNSQKQANILAASVKDRSLNSVLVGDSENKNSSIFSNPFDNTIRSENIAENYVAGSGLKNDVFKYQKKNLAEKNGTAKSVFDQTAYSYQNDRSRLLNNQQVYFKDFQDDIETVASQNDSYDSVDFRISMKHVKTSASFGHQQKHETLNRNYWHSESTEVDQRESQKYSFRKKTFNPEKQTFFANREPEHVNVSGSSPSSILDDDSEFNWYLAEANKLFKESKGCLRNHVGDDSSENALYKSAMLLSKAIEIRPMSLLAVGQLGNTYLLHGELKLRSSQELRSLLARTDHFSVEEVGKVLNQFDDQLPDKEKIKLALSGVCEECEELLINAGRKYKLALLIDGNDMRALYNWGLALSFRAQLIADIGPSAAQDADKVFMAAIDKFDAIMSKSNDYAPDALFKWGTALQHRSRLRPRNSREKVKLLQQARRLYEDALHMDSGNLQFKEALSSCVSELDYCHFTAKNKEPLAHFNLNGAQ